MYDIICTARPSASFISQLSGLKTSVNALTTRVTALEERLDAFAVNEFGRLCTTSAELYACTAIGMPAYVGGSITLPGSTSVDGLNCGVDVTMENAEIHGISNGVTNGRLVYPHNGSQRNVIRISAPGVKIKNLEISTQHPLSSATLVPDSGILLSDSTSDDLSGLVIDNCDIYDTWTGIMRSGGNQALDAPADRARITNNRIHSWCGHGIYLDWNVTRALIDNNWIRFRDAGQTHGVNRPDDGNGIWLGNFADRAIISRNRISDLLRHGIEYYRSAAIAGANGNIDAQIIDNTINDCVFGISATPSGGIGIRGNIVRRPKGIGIEAVNETYTLGRFLIADNVIEEVGFTSTQVFPSAAISADKLLNALIQGNIIGNVLSRVAGVESFGVQVVNGGKNIDIRGNHFTDSGSHGCILNGNGVDVYDLNTIENNVFRYSADYLPTYPFPTFTSWPAIRASNAGTSVVKNNTVYHPTAIAVGSLELVGTGTVYSGSTADPPLVAPGTIAESNLRVPY